MNRTTTQFSASPTTWGSPIPSPGQESTEYTGTNDDFMGRGCTTPASAMYFPGVGGLDAVSRALSGGEDSSGGGGAASALWQHIEVDR